MLDSEIVFVGGAGVEVDAPVYHLILDRLGKLFPKKVRVYHWPEAPLEVSQNEVREAITYIQRSLKKLVDLSKSSHPIHLVGHSFGGFLCSLFALCQPTRISSLTLFSSMLNFSGLSMTELNTLSKYTNDRLNIISAIVRNELNERVLQELNLTRWRGKLEQQQVDNYLIPSLHLKSSRKYHIQTVCIANLQYVFETFQSKFVNLNSSIPLFACAGGNTDTNFLLHCRALSELKSRGFNIVENKQIDAGHFWIISPLAQSIYLKWQAFLGTKSF